MSHLKKKIMPNPPIPMTAPKIKWQSYWPPKIKWQSYWAPKIKWQSYWPPKIKWQSYCPPIVLSFASILKYCCPSLHTPFFPSGTQTLVNVWGRILWNSLMGLPESTVGCQILLFVLDVHLHIEIPLIPGATAPLVPPVLMPIPHCSVFLTEICSVTASSVFTPLDTWHFNTEWVPHR